MADISSSSKFKAVTPHDTNRLEHGTCRALHVGGAGTIAIKDRDGDTVSFTVVAGQRLDVKTDRVLSTGTTATGIVALY